MASCASCTDVIASILTLCIIANKVYFYLLILNLKFSAELQLISYKRYLGVYTHSMETIYLSINAQVVVGTFFMKPPVCKGRHFIATWFKLFVLLWYHMFP